MEQNRFLLQAYAMNSLPHFGFWHTWGIFGTSKTLRRRLKFEAHPRVLHGNFLTQGEVLGREVIRLECHPVFGFYFFASVQFSGAIYGPLNIPFKRPSSFFLAARLLWHFKSDTSAIVHLTGCIKSEVKIGMADAGMVASPANFIILIGHYFSSFFWPQILACISCQDQSSIHGWHRFCL